ncbi:MULTISPECIES: SpoIIE family protein phosphatase [unclassified Streptomyces]|uniref:SpoIIE family protein phosphatase n=1 Tax=unclassified Streptomyces TaxID=2593676 RepID=UPI00114CA336|nr:SpoIIE family protein phosphatase [Streptomyces sp. DvalAA-14]MYS24211.1 SpoIIE family protein phosphatase [Streptomyces sp. SID4948]
MALVSASRTVVGWTEAAERLWGYSAEEAMNRPVDHLLMAGGDSGCASAMEQSRTWSGTVELRQPDGRGRTMELRVSPFSVGEAAGDWFVWEAGPIEPPALSSPDAVVPKALFDHAPMGALVLDRDLRCIWSNQAINEMDFIPGGPQPGRRITELLPGGGAEALEAEMRRVFESGAPSLDQEWIPPAVAGETGKPPLSLSLFPLDESDGRARGVCLMAVDTGESGSRRRLELLAEAGTRIGSTLDVMRTAQELADTAVPALADFVTVELADTVIPDEEPLGRLDASNVSVPAFYRGGMASVHPGVPEALWQRGMPVFVPPTSPYTGVRDSGQSHFEPVIDTSPGTWRDNDPDRARVVRQFGLHSLMIVPLRARGVLLGIASFVRGENPAPFSRDDLRLAEGLAARASLSLDNARRYSRERTAALALQRDLLPHQLQSGQAVEVASRYLPADTRDGVGGDWFDAIPMRHDRVALVVGDVAGHGINAAATMGRVRMVVNTLTNLELPPDQVLRRLDEVVVGLARDRPEDEFTTPIVGATCVYVVYDPATRRCTMASAGHPPPAIVTPDGDVAFADVPVGAPVGVGLGDFRSIETRLPEGSLIALYTDGLVETRADDMDHGLDRLRAALTAPAGALEDLATAIIDNVPAPGQAEDDMALLLARTLTPTPRGRP